MELEIVLPEEVPVMTLPKVAFFPQAMMPLHIFEPRYQTMLKDVLAADRLFAIAGLDEKRAAKTTQFEPPHQVASIGIVRACQKNSDGTSDLLLQGLCRVRFTDILADEPYRRVRFRVLPSQTGDATKNERLRREVARLLALKIKFGAAPSRDLYEFVRKIEDPEMFADLAAFSLCESPVLKQKLLETLDIHERLELLAGDVRHDIGQIKLRRLLQGLLPDDQIDRN